VADGGEEGETQTKERSVNMLHVDFYPSGGRTLEIVSVRTMEEAMDLIRARFPNAVRKTHWDNVGNDPADLWSYATLRVWSDSQAMEADDMGKNPIAIIINESDQSHSPASPPEPGARTFIGPIEFVGKEE
jgi:hypothetical protein